ncbi:M23 family metallopeptidase [Aphanothece sacrum]|nr:M23 family metallopeptidase [Aphanothece sacrum]
MGCLLWVLSSNLPVSSNDLISESGISNSVNLKSYGRETPKKLAGYIWPTTGVITSGFGVRWGNNMHTGIDIAGPMGTPIVAAASGVVAFVGWSPEGLGNLVVLRHPDGSVTRYGHNSQVLVRRGQTVEQGEQIALMGSTGYSTGPHLHFEVSPQGTVAVNPMGFLPGYLEANGMKRVAPDSKILESDGDGEE